MRTILSWTLLVLGAVLLALSIPAGYINRTVLDAPTFADKVNELRQRDDVSDVLGREISQQIITQNPDLVALAPLVDQISIGVVGSDVLSGPVKLAASQFNRALTTDNSDQFVLRVADVGSVVAGVIGAIAPERAPQASNLSITLANVGDQAFASDIIGYAHLVDTLAWLLPLLAVGLPRGGRPRPTGPLDSDPARRMGRHHRRGGAGSSRRARGDRRAVGRWRSRAPTPSSTVCGICSFGRSGGRSVWSPASGRCSCWSDPGARPTGISPAFAKQATTTPSTPGRVIARALVFVASGVALVIEPNGMLTLLAFVAGVVLVVSGVSALARLGAASRAERPADDGRSWGPLAITGLIGVVALVAMVVWAARPPDSGVAGASR